jgi:hypothetical protein
MPRRSPFAQGFRVLRNEPSVWLAEIAWRWVFGGIATVLLVWATLGFLHAIEVSQANHFLLRSLNPAIISYVLREMLSQKWGLLTRLGIIVSVGLSFLWMITATIARSTSTRVLVEQVAALSGEERETGSNLRAVAAIQFVRVALVWIGAAAYVLIAVVAGAVTGSGGKSHVGAFLLVFLCLFGIVAAVLSFLNWILLLAPIFAVRDAASFADSVLAGWQLTRTRGGSLTGLNLAHLAMRLIWFVFMSGIGFAPLGFVHVVPKILILLAMVLASLVYCAVADGLFVARYAGYIEIAEQELHPEAETPAVDPFVPETALQ